MSTTPDTPELPAWLYVGATVAEYTAGRGRFVDHKARRATVRKITRTQIRVALDDTDPGEVYRRRRTLGGGETYERSIGGTWGTVWDLRPLDNPAVIKAYTAAKNRAVAGRVEDLVIRWRRDGDRQAAAEIAHCLVEAGIIASYEPAAENDR